MTAKRLLLSLLFFTAFIAIWEISIRAGIWPHYFIPSPLEVVTYLEESILDGTLIQASYVTLTRLILGYLAGLIIGIPMGLLNARYQFFEDTIGVLALGFQALPSVCWAPLALLWFGQTEKAVFFIIIMGSVWSIAIATMVGVRHVPPIYVRAARTMGSKGLYTWFHVIIPAALPFIVSGMKQGWAFAWRSLMAAEIYITIITGFGLGQLLHYGRELHAMEAVIGIIIVIILIGLTIDKLIFSPLENYLYRQWGTDKNIG